MGAVHIPIIDEDALDDLVTAVQALSAPSATSVAVDATGMDIITAENAQGALKQLDTAVDSLSSSLTKLTYTDTSNGTAYAIPIEKLRIRRDFGIALVGAWKSLFVIFFNSDNTCAIYRLWSDNNMTATIAYSSGNVTITFSATVWGGITVIPF